MITENKHWYAVLTRTNSEYKVRDYFSVQNIENFLPVQPHMTETNGQLSERLRLVIPRMIFVYIHPREMSIVRGTMNVYDFLRLTPGQPPTPIPESQMADFRYMIDYSTKEVILTGEAIPRGTSVVVAKGNLKGLHGELVRYEGKYHILVRVNLFGCALVSIPANCVKKEKE